MLDRIKNVVQRFRTDYTGAPGWWTHLRHVGTRSGAAINIENSLSLSTVYAAVHKISSTVSTLTFDVRQAQGEGSILAPTHPAHKLINFSPDGYSTASTFWESIVANMLLYGKGYALVVRDSQTAEPIRLEYVPSPMVKAVVYEGQEYYEIKNLDKVVHSDSVLCIPYFMGLSPIELHRDTLGLAKDQQQYASDYFRNGGAMTGVLVAEQPLKKEQLDIVRDTWNGQHEGTTRVLPTGFKYHRLAVPNSEAQFIEGREMSQHEIARIFNVPAAMLGLDANTTYSNVEQAAIWYAKHTILPICKRIEQEVNLKLIAPVERPNYYSQFNVQDLMKGDQRTRAEYYNILVQAGCITPNEVRQAENFNPLPGADVLRMPVNTVSLEEFNSYSQKMAAQD